MKLFDFFRTYQSHIKNLLANHDEARAMSLAVGGDFETVGTLEAALLKQHGLQPRHTLIDVGCGSGRLAFQLKDWLTGTYVGVDVVPELYEYARKICGRPDWKFYSAPGLSLPEADASADFITFFSVFTHLLHEETYRYIVDCARVLRPGGKLVFSFLEFPLADHWDIFMAGYNDPNPDKVLTQFVSRDAIEAWARHAGLRVEALIDGDKPHIKLDKPLVWKDWKDGYVMEGMGHFVQSVAVLVKP